MRTHFLVAIGLLSSGCSHSPPPAAPAPGPASPGAPASPAPPTASPAFAEQHLELTIVGGPEAMAAGKTEALTARAMAPPGSQVIGVQATQGKDAFTYALALTVRVPTDGAAARPLEVQIPFSPSVGGTYYLDGARRYAIQVTGSNGYVSPTSYGSEPGRSVSFLDAMPYSGGAYVPGGTATPAPTSPPATPPPSLFGAAVPLTTLTPGAVLGNDQVAVRDIVDLKGPSTGRRGERLRFTANAWTAGDGPVGTDIVQDGFEVKVAALLAPGEHDPIGGPMPRQTSLQFSWTFQDPGQYRIMSRNGYTLGTVQVY